MKVTPIIHLIACGLWLTTLSVSQQTEPPAPDQRTSPTISGVAPGAVAPNTTLCDCYLPRDCRGRTSTCDLGGCLQQGKKDGRCDIGTAPPSASAQNAISEKDKRLIAADKAAISTALDAYFRSFIKAIENGGGHPDAQLLQSAMDVRLSQSGHENVERAVWLSLDAVMGWDFNYPTNFQRAEGFVGNIREVDGVRSANEIVEAARRGLLGALEEGDSTRVAGPLQEFWSKHPNYMPRHLGRCYPHGHAEIRDMKAAVGCQVDVLERVAGMLIDTVNSASSRPESQNGSKDGAASSGFHESENDH